jgi:phosphorylcholine metabolism protein LicD
MNLLVDKILPESILYIFSKLEKNNIFYWLDAGTLLKGVRDKTILTSSDVDISIHSDQVGNVLKSLLNLEKKGYRVQYNGGCSMLEDLITIFLPYSVNNISSIDIYIYHKYDDRYIRRSYHKPIKSSKLKYLFYLSKKVINISGFNNKQVNTEGFINFARYFVFLAGKGIFFLYEKFGKTLWYVVPEQYFSDFMPLRLHSRIFNIPKKYEEYLYFRYGSSWRTPTNRTEWFPVWRKEKNHILKSKRLSDITSIKKYWI